MPGEVVVLIIFFCCVGVMTFHDWLVNHFLGVASFSHQDLQYGALSAMGHGLPQVTRRRRLLKVLGQEFPVVALSPGSIEPATTCSKIEKLAISGFLVWKDWN